MGNPITDNVKTGTVGELLVQLRLLEFNVQAAPPIKDSGNDLIAVRGEIFRGIQVKTTAGNRIPSPDLPEHYHILALVVLSVSESSIYLDKSQIFLIPRHVIEECKGIPKDLHSFEISQGLIDKLFPKPDRPPVVARSVGRRIVNI